MVGVKFSNARGRMIRPAVGFALMPGLGLIIGFASMLGCSSKTVAPVPNDPAAYGMNEGQIQALPSYEEPLRGILGREKAGSSAARCLLVVDSTVTANAWMSQRNQMSPHGIFDHLGDSESRMLKQKSWTVIPWENSLFSKTMIKAWADRNGLNSGANGYSDLKPEDQARYQKWVAEKYSELERVQVLHVLSRPSDVHARFFQPYAEWPVADTGLFVLHDHGDQSIYRVGLVDFRKDPRQEWPTTLVVSDSVTYERKTQLREQDWKRLATLAPQIRQPAEQDQFRTERVEMGIHLSVIENFAFILPSCTPFRASQSGEPVDAQLLRLPASVE